MDNLFWLNFITLIILVIGMIVFIIAISYFDEDIQLIGLSIIACGSASLYLLNRYPQLYPLNLKRKNN